MLLNGLNLSRTPNRVTRMRGCARFSACTAAHSTNVLFISERAVPGEQHVAHECEQDVGGVEQRAGRRGDLQASRVCGKRLRALHAALNLAVERPRQVVAIRAQTVVTQSGRAAARALRPPGVADARAAPRAIR